MKDLRNTRGHGDTYRVRVCRILQVSPLENRIVSSFTNRSGVNLAKSHRLYAAASIACETDFRSFRVIISEPDALSSESCNAFVTSPMETESTMDQSSCTLRTGRSSDLEEASNKGLQKVSCSSKFNVVFSCLHFPTSALRVVQPINKIG